MSTAVAITKHIPALDGVRGLAIALVTIYRFTIGHGEPHIDDQLTKNILDFGQRGVDLFFVLSGFLITGILYDAKGESHYFRNFYFRRALRIFPLYYAVLIFAFVLLPWLGMSFPGVSQAQSEKQAWLWLYGTNILIGLEGDWNIVGPFNHFWSLAVEEQFYLVWPWLVFMLSRANLIRLCYFCIIAAMLGRMAILFMGDYSVAAEAMTPFRIDSFAVGGLISLWMRGPDQLTRIRIRSIEYGLAVLVFLITVFLNGRTLKATTYTVYACFFGTVIIWAIHARVGSLEYRFWTSAPLRFLGKYSYAIYVFQSLLIPVMRPYLSISDLISWFGSEVLGLLAYFLIMSTLSLILALLSWHLLEKHCLRLKRFFEPRGPKELDQTKS
jgi:peptidoglycan/LPS O-acetylase OafA/YrhL